MKWQPIKTAPENTPVLIFDGGMICVATLDVWSTRYPGNWCCAGVSGNDWESSFDTPTHWMPLPEAPK